jgi:hypothetical protein
LQDCWREANEEAKRVKTYSKTERQDCRNFCFKRLLSQELRWTKEWLYEQTHPPAPPAPKIEIELPPEWFAEDDEGAPAETIRETVQLLAPNVYYALIKVLPDAAIEVINDYVYVGTDEQGFKVSRTLGCYWTAHHGHWNPVAGDLLNLFKVIFEIDDDRKAWKKLDALRRRIEREDPEIRAQKAREREKRKEEAEKEFFAELKKVIWEFTEQAGTMTPPPVGPQKRAKKTARAYWEWIFLPDSSVTAEHVKAAFEFWERTKDDRYFRVESKVYPKMTNWTLVKSAEPDNILERILQGYLTPEQLAAAEKRHAKEEAKLNGQITEDDFEESAKWKQILRGTFKK